MLLSTRLAFALLLLPALVFANAPNQDSLRLVAYDLSNDGKHVVAAFYNYNRNASRVYAWSNETGKLLYARDVQTSQVVLSPTAEWMVTNRSNVVHFWNFKTGALIDSLTLSKEPGSVQFSPSGRYLVIPLAYGLASHVVDTRTWKVLQTVTGPFSSFSFDAGETRLEANPYFTDVAGSYSPPELRSMIFELSTGRFVKATYYASQEFDSVRGFSSMTYDSVVLKGQALFDEMKWRAYENEKCDCGDYFLLAHHPYVVRWDKKKFNQKVIDGLRLASDDYMIYMDCKYLVSYTSVYDVSKAKAKKIGPSKVLDELYIESMGIFEPYKIKSGTVGVIVQDEMGQNVKSVNIYRFQPELGEFPGKLIVSYRADW